MNNVKIKSDSGKTEVFVNDRKISRITDLRFEQNAGEIPRLEIDMCALPDFEVDDADIRFSITPFSFYSAIDVIRKAKDDKSVSSEVILSSLGCLIKELVGGKTNDCILIRDTEILKAKLLGERRLGILDMDPPYRIPSERLLSDELEKVRRIIIETTD